MKFLLIPIISLLTIHNLSANTISGRVQEYDTGKSLAGVNIYVRNTPFGTSTSEDGSFVIEGLSKGKYLATAELIGYQSLSFFVEVREGETKPLELALEPSVLSLNSHIVSTAQRYRNEAFNLPEAIGLMNREDFHKQNPRSLPEALIGMTGVWIQKTNHGGGSPFIRGLTGNQTLILIDGIRLNNATFRYGPNQYLNTIDPNSIERLEILRGSGSVLYGSDALGGVVQVITNQPQFSKGKTKVTGHSNIKYMSADMEKSGSAILNVSNNKLVLAGNITMNQFGDIVAGGNLGTEAPSAYDQYAWGLKAIARIEDQMLLTTAIQYLRQNDVPRFDQVQRGVYKTYSFDPQIRLLSYARLQRFQKNQWIRQFVLTTSLHRSEEGRTKIKTGSEVRTKERDNVNTWGLTAEVYSQISEVWQMISGIEYYKDHVDSWRKDYDQGMVEQKRGLYTDGAHSDNLAFYSSHTYAINKMNFRAGVRYNLVQVEADDELFGSMKIAPNALVGNFSAFYNIIPAYHFVLNLNSAFRAPNINDLSSFGSFDYGIEVPNADLSPEKSVTFESGLKRKGKLFSGSLFVYRTQLFDLLDRVRATYQGTDLYNGEQVYRKENIAEAYIQGIEGEWEFRIIPGLNTFGNVVYTYGQNISKDEPVRRIPPLNSRLGLRYHPLNTIWVRLEWLSSVKQDRLSGGDKDDHRIPEGGTPGWQILNILSSWQINAFRINLGLINLFDEAYRMHGSGTDGYGRSMTVSLSYRF